MIPSLAICDMKRKINGSLFWLIDGRKKTFRMKEEGESKSLEGLEPTTLGTQSLMLFQWNLQLSNPLLLTNFRWFFWFLLTNGAGCTVGKCSNWNGHLHNASASQGSFDTVHSPPSSISKLSPKLTIMKLRSTLLLLFLLLLLLLAEQKPNKNSKNSSRAFSRCFHANEHIW